MDAFSPVLLSLWFKGVIVLSIVWFLTKLLRHIYIDGTINALIKMPDDQKERLIERYRNAISTRRIFLRLLPLILILLVILVIIPIVFAPYLKETEVEPIRQITPIFVLSFVVAYGHMLEDSLYRKKILKAIDSSKNTSR
jgi:hypothetical protein